MRGGSGIIPVVPGRPAVGICLGGGSVADDCRQVIERIGLIGPASLDQAHERIPHLSSARGAVKQTIFAVQDRQLQNSFGGVMPPANLCRAAA